MTERHTDNDAVVYLVGGGIASLAAAAFLIRDGDIPGHNITILEESAKIGGSLDAAGTTTDGYVMRGGRMLESKYLCTYDLFSSIPTLDERKTVTQEIFEWNETMKPHLSPVSFGMAIGSTLPNSASPKDISWPSSAWEFSRKGFSVEAAFRISLTPRSLIQIFGSCGVRHLPFNPGTARWN
jgi:hypothetical protein